MVAKKHKSKRITCREKYKIIKRKNRAKKNLNQKSKKQSPITIPNLFPLKHELLNSITSSGDNNLTLDTTLDTTADGTLMNDAANDTLMNDDDTEKKDTEKDVIGKLPHVLLSDLLQSPVLIQVIDARDPLQHTFKLQNTTIYCLSFIDNVPSQSIQKWLNLLPNAILFSLKNPLLKLQLEKVLSKLNLDTNTEISVFGYPRVGKQTVIHYLTKQGFNVAQTPGICFAVTDILERSDQCLLLNHKNSNKVPSPLQVCKTLLSRFRKDWLFRFYNTPFCVNLDDFLVQVARKRSMLKRGGIPDTIQASRSIIQDYFQNKLPFYTTPTPSPTTLNNQFEFYLNGNIVIDGIVVKDGSDSGCLMNGFDGSLIKPTRLDAWPLLDCDFGIKELPKDYAEKSSSVVYGHYLESDDEMESDEELELDSGDEMESGDEIESGDEMESDEELLDEEELESDEQDSD